MTQGLSPTAASMAAPAKAAPRGLQRVLAVLRWPLLRLVLGIAWMAGWLWLASRLKPLLPPQPPGLLMPVMVLAALLGYLSFVVVLEGRRPVELLHRAAVPELLAGTLLGVALLSTTLGLMALLGVFSITGINPEAALWPILAESVMAGVVEELIVRGLVFRILEQWLGSWVALALSAALFGALHLFNPHATLFSALAIALEAGVMLAAAFVLTRRLWLPIGIHLGWNFAQGGLFGVATSGKAYTGWLQGKLQGPELLSGGAFGAEGSVVALAVCLSAGLVLLWRARVAGQLRPGPWAR